MPTTPTIPLQPVDEVRVTIVMDNSFDFLLPSTPVARRVRLGPSPFTHLQPRAEHGYGTVSWMKTIQTAPRFADPGRIVRFLSTPDATESRSVPG